MSPDPHDHAHELSACKECDYYAPGVCMECDGRGYHEVCWRCGARMGNEGRKQRRAEVTRPYTLAELADTQLPENP